MQQDNARNTIIFVVCTLALLLVYNQFVIKPQSDLRRAQAVANAEAQAQTQHREVPGVVVDKTYPTRQAAVDASARIRIDTPTMSGSIALTGGRIDDLYLKQYRQKLEKDSAPVELFTPFGFKHAYFAQLGWLNAATGKELLSPDAPWKPIYGDVLSPGKSVVLRFDTVENVSFIRTISVDDRSMFTIKDTVVNNTGAPLNVAPMALVQRNGLPDEVTKGVVNVHQGAIGTFVHDKPTTVTFSYKDWAKKSAKKDKALVQETNGGWLGITDKYWLAAIAPDQTEKGKGTFRVSPSEGGDIYEANFIGVSRTIAPREHKDETTRIFAGAKRKEVLDAYKNGYQYGKPSDNKLGLPRFDYAIDWGRLFFLTQPVFWLIELFYKWVGNFGVAILMLTVVVRGVFFPLANQTFASGAKMKKLQPEIEKLKARHKDDPAKLQQEQMALFQREKINPLAGCLPILVQIPVFLALFKVLSTTIEMRHAPFFWFIHDLSARDPSTIWKLFGLINWDPAQAPMIGGVLDGALHIGVLALLYAGAMALQQAMTPVSADPTQTAIMKFFPIVFMFILANYPVGLLIYWTWSTCLSLGQQYWFMRRYKVDNPIDRFLQRIGAEKAPAG